MDSLVGVGLKKTIWRAGQILILGFYLDNFRDKNRRKIVKSGARKEKTAQKSKSKSRAGFILILGSNKVKVAPVWGKAK